LGFVLFFLIRNLKQFTVVVGLDPELVKFVFIFETLRRITKEFLNEIHYSHQFSDGTAETHLHHVWDGLLLIIGQFDLNLPYSYFKL